MLQLLASEKHPRTEENVCGVAVNHREQQVVELESHHTEVDYRRANSPWIPRFEHESRNRNNHRLVSLVVSLKFRAVSEESNCCPEDCCSNCCNHDEQEQSPHL